MHNRLTRAFVPVFLVLVALAAGSGLVMSAEQEFETGKPALKSMSALTFGPDGILFIGDGKGGAVFAIDLGDTTPRKSNEGMRVAQIEAKLAAFLGTTADEVMVHDMAVNPISQNTYLAVSRGRSDWSSRCLLPNDVADASALIKVSPEGLIGDVSLNNVRFASSPLPNPVDDEKTHLWKRGISLRADTITDLVVHDGTVYVAGLSNEEFASTMWRVPYPFAEGTTATTLEIFHGAHGEYETHAPIRTFVPYELNDEEHLLAAYLCTPLVTFETSDLKDGPVFGGSRRIEWRITPARVVARVDSDDIVPITGRWITKKPG